MGTRVALCAGMKTLEVIALVAGLLLATTTATLAGAKYDAPVTFGTNSASGSLGHVRHTPTTRDRIGCTLYSYGSGTVAHCFAVDDGGFWKTCTTSNPDHVAVARSLTDSSYMTFRVAPSTGQCDYIMIVNDSAYAPK